MIGCCMHGFMLYHGGHVSIDTAPGGYCSLFTRRCAVGYSVVHDTAVVPC